MVKLITIFLAALLVVGSQSLNIGKVGGYTDHPELIENSNIKALVKYAAEYLASNDNLDLGEITITRVQTQLVAGTNYKIEFTSRSNNGDNKLTICEAVIYERFDSTRKITSAHCN
ncbi:unnamed protein product [Adineta steineri]|uniref:Cystatin domain-containing protein n=1 Tax=Adineta steineri TaxID=433720 RepID=A0A815PIN1_9BILA|nr:unnamed protein product [Adineta steineri]CAF1449352.1 unnamed protein product [Adineta steineri]CAF3741009.1 unnamed protein product [Adineta steineri]CAF4016540.1 unnamed protein product [Adineta steineri]